MPTQWLMSLTCNFKAYWHSSVDWFCENARLIEDTKLREQLAIANDLLHKEFVTKEWVLANGGGGGSGISNQYNQNNITFTNTTGDYFGTQTAPRSGTLTFDVTGAVTGGIAVCYYSNATFDIPVTLITVGEFKPNEVNKLYFERDSEGNITCNILNDLQTDYVKSDVTIAGGGQKFDNMVSITQAQYDALGTPNANTWYFING